MRLLDVHHLGNKGIIFAGLAGTGDLTLIDCGPESAFANSVTELRRIGLDPHRVSCVLLTHIHLDHAGAAWRWATEYGCTIRVHPNGLPHLVDPTRLLSSARRVFGDELERLWGELRPVPAHLVKAIQNGEWIGEGDTRFRAIETPGHAQHHHAYWHDDSRSIYAGDVAGVSIHGGPLVPPCPPPDIDLPAWHRSLARLRELAPDRILLTHGGVLRGTQPLDALEARLGTWSQWVLQQLRAGKPESAMVREFEEFVWSELRSGGLDDAGIAAYEQGDPAAMSAYGLARYWQKHRPEAGTGS